MKKPYETVFDVPLKSVDNTEGFLKRFMGKALLFVNTTGECGNSTQFPIIEEIASMFDPQDFEVIYVPTNDFCGSVTYGDYINGLKSGKDSQEYAIKTYDVKSAFSELVSSRNSFWENKNWTWTEDEDWDLNKKQNLAEEYQPPRSELYNFLLGPETPDMMGGNFHKVLTNKKGQPVAFFHNGTLLDAALINANKMGIISETFDAETEKKNLISIISEVIETGQCSNNYYKFDPYNGIMPEWMNYARNHTIIAQEKEKAL